MSPLSSVLVPLDVLDDGERALPAAVWLCRRAGVPMHLFSWCADADDAPGVERYLSILASELPVPATFEVSVGGTRSAAAAIAMTANSRGATVCMTSRGRSGLGAGLLGSVAEETLRRTQRAVVLVGPHAGGSPAGDGALVACLDGSPFAEQVLPAAQEWAATLSLQLTLVETVQMASSDPGTSPPDVIEAGYLASVASGRGGALTKDYEVLHGDPARSIAQFTHDRPAALIAVTSHVRHGVERIVLGSVAMRVVHHADSPVLVIPGVKSAG